MWGDYAALGRLPMPSPETGAPEQAPTEETRTGRAPETVSQRVKFGSMIREAWVRCAAVRLRRSAGGATRRRGDGSDRVCGVDRAWRTLGRVVPADPNWCARLWTGCTRRRSARHRVGNCPRVFPRHQPIAASCSRLAPLACSGRDQHGLAVRVVLRGGTACDGIARIYSERDDAVLCPPSLVPSG